MLAKNYLREAKASSPLILTQTEDQLISKNPNLDFFAGGGEMGRRMSEFDWGRTPLGPIESWPQSLKTAVSLMLGSQHPMWIGWRRENIFLYNDAYIAVLGLDKHPWALGRPADEVWAEIWDICGPLSDKVFQKGEAGFFADIRLFMRRGDFLEETFYSFSYSPIRDETGNVAGLFCPSSDVTAKNLNARRLATLSELAAKSLVEKSPAAAGSAALECLSKNPDDVPFVLLYLANEAGDEAVLAQTAGLLADSALAPVTIPLKLGEAPLWPVAEVLHSSEPRVVSVRHLSFPFSGAAGQPLADAIVLPLAARGQERPFGALVAGINPTRRPDAEYQTFYTLVAAQVAAAIANARAAQEERKRVEALAELDRAKTAFFSNVSHEFRTPLTLMLGPIEDELRKESGANNNLQLAHRNSLRLLKLVNTLLDFSRLEAGRIQAHYEPTDLAAYTTGLASVFRSAAEKAGLRFVVDCPPLPEPVYVDREMWEKVVMNLLSNALKFTFEGEIKLTLRRSGDHVELSVADTGVGIPAAEISRIFQRFHRVRGMRSRTHEGTGIGLALVQELARLHGGRVGVQSREGHGSTFTVAILAGKSHLPPGAIGASDVATQARSVAGQYVEESTGWIQESISVARLGQPDSLLDTSSLLPANDRSPDAPRVLLADDNADMREYLRRLLARDYRVEAVSDGQAALDSMQKNLPDVLLTDVMMPRLDGFGLLREVRSNERTRTLPVIMLSARAGEEARVEGLGFGADEYLAKPFSARELLARVRSQLEMARLRREGEERVNLILASITDAFLAIDAAWRITYLNPAAHQIMAAHGMDVDALLKKHLWEEAFPSARGTLVERELQRAMAGRIHVGFESVYQPWQRWFSIRVFPMEDGGLAIYSQDITAIKEAERERKQAQQILERTVTERTARLIETIGELEAFSYSIAHDMRAPLRSLQSFGKFLEDEYGNKLDSTAQGYLRRITGSADCMDRLIQDVLNYSKIVRSELPIEPVDIESLLRGIIESYPGLQKEYAIIEINGPLPRVNANQAGLTQSLSNLLGNAVKFVAPGVKPHVRVWAENRGKHTRLLLRDNGIGIPQDQHEKIFGMFQRLSKDYDGTGIGLTIVKKSVERMGGRVGLISETGQGSTFWIEFPEMAEAEPT